jgi:hypothetical protein
VSLWDIVNQFDVTQLVLGIQNLGMVEAQLATMVKMGGGNRRIDDERFERLISSIQFVRKVCVQSDFMELAQKLDLAMRNIQNPLDTDVSTIRAELRSVTDAFLTEGAKRRFLEVKPDRVAYLDQDALFGPEVNTAFPSAIPDIRKSGNCLAAECSDAAVFHLMHVAEYGLRALATDRQIALPKGAVLDLATWEDIIRKLEVAEQAIQGYPKTLAREEQYGFYHGAMMEFKRFKNVFRNRIMHTRDEYDRDEAHSAFVHVKAFMNILASKISETSTTPEIWV